MTIIQVPPGSIDPSRDPAFKAGMEKMLGPRVTLAELAQDELDEDLSGLSDEEKRSALFRRMARRHWCRLSNEAVDAEKERLRKERRALVVRDGLDAYSTALHALSADPTNDDALLDQARAAVDVVMAGGDPRLLFAPIASVGKELETRGVDPGKLKAWAAAACFVADEIASRYAARDDLATVPLRPVKAGRSRARKSAGGPRRASRKSSGSGDDDPSEPPGGSAPPALSQRRGDEHARGTVGGPRRDRGERASVPHLLATEGSR